MTVGIESFLVVERSLSDRLKGSWRREVASVTAKIVNAVDDGDFQTAADLTAQLSMVGAMGRNRKFAEFVGKQSILFGASRLSDGDPSATETDPQPDDVTSATDILEQSIAVGGTLQVIRKAQELIGIEEAAQHDAAVEKAVGDGLVRRSATEGFVTDFVSNVNDSGEAFIDIGSSLHTSRLASWGFTAEAEARGITTYQVSEQLDGRTCPVCRTMHGKTFRVTEAREKLQRWLSTNDANELKSMAPWPKQDQASVFELGLMEDSEIQERGWDTPPYHPLCRGVLVKRGTISVEEEEETGLLNAVTQVVTQGGNALDTIIKVIDNIYGIDIKKELARRGAQKLGWLLWRYLHRNDVRIEKEILNDPLFLANPLIDASRRLPGPQGLLPAPPSAVIPPVLVAPRLPVPSGPVISLPRDFMPDTEGQLRAVHRIDWEDSADQGPHVSGRPTGLTGFVNSPEELYQKIFFMGPEEIRENLDRIMASSHAYMGMSYRDLLNDILPSGQFKNSLETGVGTFKTAGLDRVPLERLMFNIRAATDDVDAFPKYGFLSDGPDGPDASQRQVLSYGSIVVRFKKENVFHRSTTTLGDSFRNRPEFAYDWKKGDVIDFIEWDDVAKKDVVSRVAIHRAPGRAGDDLDRSVSIIRLGEEFEDLDNLNLPEKVFLQNIDPKNATGVARWNQIAPAVRWNDPDVAYVWSYHDARHDPGRAGFDPKPIPMRFADIDTLTQYHRREYAELQIYGRLTLDDVAEIYIGKKSQAREIRDRLEELGVQIELKPSPLNKILADIVRRDMFDRKTIAKRDSLTPEDVDNLPGIIPNQIAAMHLDELDEFARRGTIPTTDPTKRNTPMTPEDFPAGILREGFIKTVGMGGPFDERAWLRAYQAEIIKKQNGAFRDWDMLWKDIDEDQFGWTEDMWFVGQALDPPPPPVYRYTATDGALARRERGIEVMFRSNVPDNERLTGLSSLTDEDARAEVWKRHFGNKTPVDVLDEFLGPLKMDISELPDGPVNGPFGQFGEMTISNSWVRLRTDIAEIGPDGRTPRKGELSRRIELQSDGKLVATHNLFTLEKVHQGRGIAKAVLKSQMSLYKDMGVDVIELDANIDVGGYAWAKYGFKPTQKDWDEMRNNFAAILNDPLTGEPKLTEETIWQLFALSKDKFHESHPSARHAEAMLSAILEDPDPRGIWRLADLNLGVGGKKLGKEMLLGSKWRGELDLNDPEAVARFNQYVEDGQ